MFQRMIDDLKETTARAARLTSLAAAAALALLVAAAFLCAAAFIYVLQTYGPIEACLSLAGLFFIVALVAGGAYMARKNQVKARAAATQKSAVHSMLSDPMLVAAGIQVIRAIGVKRLVPLLAVGGLALGLFASRNTAAAKDEPPEA